MDSSIIAANGGLWLDQVAEEIGSVPLEASPIELTFIFPNVTRRKGPARSARRQAEFFDPFPIQPSPVPTWFAPIYPSNVVRRKGPTRSARRPFWFAPIDRPFDPIFTGIIPFVQPQRPMKVRKTAHKRPAYAAPTVTIADPTVTPIGPTTVATIAIDPLANTTVTFEFGTDVQKSWSGLELRRSLMRKPRQKYDFKAVLDDAFTRFTLSMLSANAADAPAFLLGLTHEEQTIVSASSTTITANSLSLCDWAMPGQRIVVMGPDGSVDDTYIKFASGNVLTVADDVTAIATVRGSRVMPAFAVYLDPTQSMGRHTVNADEWSLVALAAQHSFGNGTGTIGTGATVATHDSIPVWDSGIKSGQNPVGQPLHAGTDIIDLGFSVDAFPRPGGITDWGREIIYDTDTQLQWQWFKAFIHTIRGRAIKFLLPTGRPDLVPIGDASSGTLTVQGPPTVNAPDYVGAWFPSLAHRRLKLVKTDGTYAYRTITGAIDNGDGTQGLSVAALAGALARVEFLETVRLDTDVITVTWFGGANFSVRLPAMVVQQ